MLSQYSYLLDETKKYKSINDIYFTLTLNKFLFEYVKPEHQTFDICMKMIDLNIINIKYLKNIENKETLEKINELYIHAVNISKGDALLYIDEDKQTYELCKLAVQKNPLTLKLIKNQNKIQNINEIYETAVKQNGYSIIYVKNKTQELCNMAVKQNGLCIVNINKQFKTDELINMAIEQNNLAINHIPKSYKTKELYDKILTKNPILLQFILKSIPLDILTYEMCKNAIIQNCGCLKDIPEKFKTFEICEMAINKNGLLIQHVKKENRSYELCLLAMKQNIYSRHHIEMTIPLYKYMIDNIKYVLYYIISDYKKHIESNINDKEKFMTTLNHLCEYAVNINGLFIQDIYGDLQTEEICKLAVKQNGLALDFVISKYKTDEIYKLALIQNTKSMIYIDKFSDDIMDFIINNCFESSKEIIKTLKFTEPEKIRFLNKIQNVINTDIVLDDLSI